MEVLVLGSYLSHIGLILEVENVFPRTTNIQLGLVSIIAH